MLIALGHSGIQLDNLGPKIKAKIQRAIEMYDQSDTVYHELFRQDEITELQVVLKDKDELRKKRTIEAMVREAKETLESR